MIMCSGVSLRSPCAFAVARVAPRTNYYLCVLRRLDRRTSKARQPSCRATQRSDSPISLGASCAANSPAPLSRYPVLDWAFVPCLTRVIPLHLPLFKGESCVVPFATPPLEKGRDRWGSDWYFRAPHKRPRRRSATDPGLDPGKEQARENKYTALSPFHVSLTAHGNKHRNP